MSNSALSTNSMQNIRERCDFRDRLYSRKFYGRAFFEVLEPLLSSILDNGGVPKATTDRDTPLPETTATCLLALYRMGYLNNATKEKMQSFLFSTHLQVSSLIQNNITVASYTPQWEQSCWSVAEGPNVWSTVNSLWALLATKYQGVFYPSILASLLWLVRQQEVNGSWKLDKSSTNEPNIFLTSNVIYILQLSSNIAGFNIVEKREIGKSIENGVAFILNSRSHKKGYWSYNPQDPTDHSIEPTTTVTALWALQACLGKEAEPIIKKGLRGLRQELKGKPIWDDKPIVHGEISEKDSIKTLQGYTPAIALTLMRIGVHPMDEMVLKSINILRSDHRIDGWPFGTTSPLYMPMAAHVKKKGLYYVGSGQSLTFTTALALWTIEYWHSQLLQKRVGPLLTNTYMNGTVDAISRKRSEIVVNRRHLIVMMSVLWSMFTTIYYIFIYLVITRLWSNVSPMIEIGINDIPGIIISMLFIAFPPILLLLILRNFLEYGRISWDGVLDWLRFFRFWN